MFVRFSTISHRETVSSIQASPLTQTRWRRTRRKRQRGCRQRQTYKELSGNIFEKLTKKCFGKVDTLLIATHQWLSIFVCAHQSIRFYSFCHSFGLNKILFAIWIGNTLVKKMANDLFTDGGKIIKMEVDYNETVTEKLPVCQKLAKVNKVNHVVVYNSNIFICRKESFQKLWIFFWLWKNKLER